MDRAAGLETGEAVGLRCWDRACPRKGLPEDSDVPPTQPTALATVTSNTAAEPNAVARETPQQERELVTTLQEPAMITPPVSKDVQDEAVANTLGPSWPRP